MAIKKFYAVQRGRKIGVFTTWAECQKQVQGFSGAVYKSFPSMAEAKAFSQGQSGLSVAEFFSDNEVVSKNARHDEQRDKDLLAYIVTQGGLVAYIDGSYDKRSNTVGAGGILFFKDKKETFSFGTKDSKYVSYWNVAGELLAAMHVMNFAKMNGFASCHIYYDYMGIEMWATKGWKCNNELTKSYAEFAQTIMTQVQVYFHKVAAHTGNTYNELADQLAKQGVLKA